MAQLQGSMRAGPTGPWAFHPDDVKVKVKVFGPIEYRWWSLSNITFCIYKYRPFKRKFGYRDQSKHIHLYLYRLSVFFFSQKKQLKWKFRNVTSASLAKFDQE